MQNIINILKKKKFLPIDQFINISLYNKEFGYYMKKNPFGVDGDYITAPLVSKLFGEMIAVWIIAFWEHLGKPEKILLVELGPGNGTLCKIILDTFKNFRDFYDCLEIKLLEKSPKLKKNQKKKLINKKVKWIKSIKDLKHGPIIFLGNEFFDSLAIKQFYFKKKLFFERCIKLSKSNKKIEFSYKKAPKSFIKDISKLKLSNKEKIIEYPCEAIKYLKIISKKINKFGGGLLSFDYGYNKNRNFDSLQSVKNHKYHNILSKPGTSDITSHINYKLFTKILIENDLDVNKVVSQSEFLQRLGIIERANMISRNSNFKKKADIFYRLRKLLHYKEMGQLFKVIFAKKKGKKFSLGF